MSDKVKTITQTNFRTDVLASDKPVLVDFWAVWCAPCRQLSPIVDSLAEKWGDQVTVGKLNVDDEHSIAEEYGVMSIPTLVLFKNGAVVERVVGVAPQATLEKRFGQYIS